MEILHGHLAAGGFVEPAIHLGQPRRRHIPAVGVCYAAPGERCGTYTVARGRDRERQEEPRGMTLLETMISTSIMLTVIAGFLGALKMYSDGVAFHGAIYGQVRLAEQMIDDMLIGLRWISVSEGEELKSYGGTEAGKPPMISFRRIKGLNPYYAVVGEAPDMEYVYGDRISYYWLPSERENAKYASGDKSLYDPADIDGVDHDGNGVRNDGVIWREVEDADGDGNLDDIGYDSFGGTADRRIVFTNVPPPFVPVAGTPVSLDSFRVDVNCTNRSVTLTIKRFVDAASPQPNSNMPPHPQGVAFSDAAVVNPNVIVMTARRTFCVRN